MENLQKDMILYERHPIIYTSWNLNDAPKAITSKRLSLKFTIFLFWIMVTYTKSFSIPSKAFLFLSLQTTHIRTNKATSMPLVFYSYVCQHSYAWHHPLVTIIKKNMASPTVCQNNSRSPSTNLTPPYNAPKYD